MSITHSAEQKYLLKWIGSVNRCIRVRDRNSREGEYSRQRLRKECREEVGNPDSQPLLTLRTYMPGVGGGAVAGGAVVVVGVGVVVVVGIVVVVVVLVVVVHGLVIVPPPVGH